MENLKIKVWSQNHAYEIQKYLFELGYKWGDKGDSKELRYESDMCYLYTNKSGYLGYGSTSKLFDQRVQFKEIFVYFAGKSTPEKNTKSILKPTIKPMEISKTQPVKVQGKHNRIITITVVLEDSGKLRAGYSVKLPSDTKDNDFAIDISRGRAMKDKTNLIDMEIGYGMNKKFILYAIADNIFGSIERGSIKIKGVKKETKK